MGEDKISLLLVEDNPGDANLIKMMLSEDETQAYDVTHVDRLSTALDHLRQGGVDVLLVDLALPDSWGWTPS